MVKYGSAPASLCTAASLQGTGETLTMGIGVDMDMGVEAPAGAEEAVPSPVEGTAVVSAFQRRNMPAVPSATRSSRRIVGDCSLQCT